MLGRILMVLLSLTMMSGCASLVGGGRGDLSIEGDRDVAYELFDEERKLVSAGVLPATVTLDTSDGYFDGMTYAVLFHKTGEEDRELSVDTKLSSWYLLGNLLSFNVIGWFLVDPFTGAMWTLDQERIGSPYSN